MDKPLPPGDHDDKPDLRLREVRDADLPVFFEHQRDEEAARLAAFSPRPASAFYAHWAKIRADPQTTIRAVTCGGPVIGNVVAFDAGGTREVGYWIGREHWGRGHATAALRQFLAVEPRRPLHAAVAAHNAGSIRVLEKCGFTRHSEVLDDGVAMAIFKLG